jgi:hypothetical protein
MCWRSRSSSRRCGICWSATSAGKPLLQAVGAVPETVGRMRDLEGEDLTRYKTLARLLTHLKGVVVSSRKTEEGGGSPTVSKEVLSV